MECLGGLGLLGICACMLACHPDVDRVTSLPVLVQLPPCGAGSACPSLDRASSGFGAQFAGARTKAATPPARSSGLLSAARKMLIGTPCLMDSRMMSCTALTFRQRPWQ